jgi:hypothetical protein
MPFLVPVFGIVFFFGSACYVAYVILEGIRSRQQARLTSEFHQKLLDRVGSAQELSELLNSEGGARLLATMSPSGARQTGGVPFRILRALQAGLVLLALGIGLFIFAGSRALSLEGADVVTMIATIATALGVGLLASAAASYVLSRRMGLLREPDSAAPNRMPMA